MPHNLSRERNLPEPLKIRTDWFNPSIAHQYLCSSDAPFRAIDPGRELPVNYSQLAFWRTRRESQPTMRNHMMAGVRPAEHRQAPDAWVRRA